jgi:hypothetical protein
MANSPVSAFGWVFKAPNQHPWIVVSCQLKHPKRQCLCVNVTDPSNYTVADFVLKKGCHSMITKDSVLYYLEPFDTTPDRIESRIASGYFERREDLNPTLLKRVVEACRQTRHFPEHYRYYLHL